MAYNPHEVLFVHEFEADIPFKRIPGTSVYVDTLLKGVSGNVYRYMTPTPEAAALLRAGRLRFDHPTKWEDPYESYIADHLFDKAKTANSSLGGSATFDEYAVYVKCMTYHYASEAMWRLNTAKVRVTFRLEKLLQLLASARRADGGPMHKIYVSRARYMEPRVIRETIAALRGSTVKPVARNIVAALMMKRVGF